LTETRSALTDLPEFRTERLLLRKLSPDDAREVFAYASDPEVARHTTWEAHRSVEESGEFLEKVAERYRLGSHASWGVVHEESGRLIGTCGFDSSWAPAHNRAELGYVLSREFWGRGIMPEAARAVIGFGFEQMGLNKVVARCLVENTASERVMRKLGMTFEGIQRQEVFIKGAYRDIKVYSILRSEFR
jgi:ribosomal-protein-alanine N-acetyltransferase